MGPLRLILWRTVGKGNRSRAHFYLCPAEDKHGEPSTARRLFCSPLDNNVQYVPRTRVVKITVALEDVPGSERARLGATWEGLNEQINRALRQAAFDPNNSVLVNFDFPTERSLPHQRASDLTLYAVVQETDAGTLLSRPIYISKRLNLKRRDDVLELLSTGAPTTLLALPAFIPLQQEEDNDDMSSYTRAAVESADWLGLTTGDALVSDRFIFQRTPLDGTHHLDPEWVSYQSGGGEFLHVPFDPTVRGIEMIFETPGLYIVFAHREGHASVMRVIWVTGPVNDFLVSSPRGGAGADDDVPSYGRGGAGAGGGGAGFGGPGAGPGGSGAGSGGSGSGSGSSGTGFGAYTDYTTLRLLGITGDVIRATNGSTYSAVYPSPARISAQLEARLRASRAEIMDASLDLDLSLTSDTDVSPPPHTTSFPRPPLPTAEERFFDDRSVHIMAVCKRAECVALCGGLHEACMHHQCHGKPTPKTQCNQIIFRDEAAVPTVAAAHAVTSAFCYTCEKEQPVGTMNYCPEVPGGDNYAALLDEHFVFREDPLAVEHGFACSMCNERHDKMLWLSCGCFVGVGLDRACFFNMMQKSIQARKVVNSQGDAYTYVCSNPAHPSVESLDIKVFRLAGTERLSNGLDVYKTCSEECTKEAIKSMSTVNLQHHAQQAAHEVARKAEEEKATMLAHMKRLREENKALKKRIILLETPPAPASPGQQPGTPHAKTASPVQLTPETPQAHTHAAH